MRALGGLAWLALSAAAASGQEPTVQEGHVTTDDGVRLHWQAIGERGDTVVFLHGGPGGRVQNQLLNLSELASTHVVLGYTQRGVPGSEADTATLTVERHVEDLEAVRRHLGLERLTLFGHSWGTALAVLYAERYPERVARLILNAPMPPARTPFAAERDSAMLVRRTEVCTASLGAAADTSSMRACVSNPATQRIAYLADTASLRRARGDMAREAFAGLDRTALRVMMRALGDWDFRRAMARVRAPTLVTEGALTPIPLEQVRMWAETIPDARLLLVPRTGHGAPFIENPEVFFPALREFLAGSWPAASVGAPWPGLVGRNERE